MNDEKNKQLGNIIVNTQYIKDLSFENPKAPYSLLEEQKPEVDIALDINAQEIQESMFEVVLGIQAKTLVNNEVQFLVDLKYAGVFTLDKSIKEKEMVLLVNCPTLIFPYARRIISDVTRDGGYLPLMISPIDFFKLYYDKKNGQESKTIN